MSLLLVRTNSATLRLREAWALPAPKMWMKALPVAPGHTVERKPEEIRIQRTVTATAAKFAFWRKESLAARLTEAFWGPANSQWKAMSSNFDFLERGLQPATHSGKIGELGSGSIATPQQM